MPMLTTRILLLGIIFCISMPKAYAAASYADTFQLPDVINTHTSDAVTRFYTEDSSLPLAEQKVLMEKIGETLQKHNKALQEDANYWFLRGLHESNMSTISALLNDADKSAEHQQTKVDFFSKAVTLDKNNKVKLSTAAYSTMKHSLSGDMKILATQRELKQGGNGESDSYYWYLHWQNISQLKEAGRDEEAEDAFQKMQKELKDSGQDVSMYKSLTDKIEQDTLDIKEPPKETKKPEKKPAPKPLEPAKSLDKQTLIFLVIAITSIVFIALVTLYEFKFKKKKKKKQKAIRL